MATIFRVGGCVRDHLMAVHTKDIDFTYVVDDVTKSVDAGFAEMHEYLLNEGFNVFLVTPDCFTIRAKFPTSHKFAGLVADFVMARKEVGYVEGTRRPILELGTLRDDLIRRDFTLNAMAMDVDGNIIDMFGGRIDLEKRLLRTPIDAHITMMDDPLRILRALRFSITKGFAIHPSIYESLRVKGVLEKLKTTVSAERVREELHKMMAVDTIKSIRLIEYVDKKHAPGFTHIILGRGMWLKPTFEKH